MDTIAERAELVIWGVMLFAGAAWATGRALHRRLPTFPWSHVTALVAYLTVTAVVLVIMNLDAIATNPDGEKEVNFDGVWLVAQTCLFVGYWIARIRRVRQHLI